MALKKAIKAKDLAKAKSLGYTLSETPHGVAASKGPHTLVFANAQGALINAEALDKLLAYGNLTIKVVGGGTIEVTNTDTGEKLLGGPHTPFTALSKLDEDQADWEPAPKKNGNGPAVEIKEVPKNGGEAFTAKFVAADNPFLEGSPEAAEWDAQFDEAADAAAQADADKSRGSGSVVSDRYRAKYAEQGHPNHCGDWLAMVLNNLVANKGGTNIELFDQIMAMNNVNTDKYDRTRSGWQGRLRMTGRNLLAKKVFAAGGKLLTPQGEMQAPGDWMASQKFKK